MSELGAIVIYDYLDGTRNPIEEFVAGLDSDVRAKIEFRIHALEVNGFVLLGSSMLTDTKLPLKEIRANGRVAVRLLCFRGRSKDGQSEELTLLFGAFERDRRYVPKDALMIAEGRRKEVITDPENRRKKRQ